MSDKRVKTRATKRISPKKSPCVACPPSKTKTAKKQLKLTTLTPDSGGDAAIEAAPLADTSVLDASVASDGFGDVTMIPRSSVGDFVVTTDPYAPVSSVTTARVSDAFDVFESSAQSVLGVTAAPHDVMDPYERYKAFERREKRRRSRSAFDSNLTALVDSSGATATLPTPISTAAHAKLPRPRVASTIVRPAIGSDLHIDTTRPRRAAATSTVARAPAETTPVDSSVVDRDLHVSAHAAYPGYVVTSSTPLMAPFKPHAIPRALSVPVQPAAPQEPADVGLMKELRDLLRDTRSVSRVRDIVRRSRAPSAVSRGTKHTATPTRASPRRPSRDGSTPVRSKPAKRRSSQHDTSKTRRASKGASRRREKSGSKHAPRKTRKHRSKQHDDSDESTSSDSEVSESSDDSDVSDGTPSPRRKRRRAAGRRSSNYKMNLTFNGSDWYSFINHFKLLARKHKWGEKDKVINLLDALTGPAVRVTRTKGVYTMSFKGVVRLLERKYGQNKPLITVHDALCRKTRRPDEDWDDFIDRLRDTADKMNVTEKVRENVLKQVLNRALEVEDKDLRAYVTKYAYDKSVDKMQRCITDYLELHPTQQVTRLNVCKPGKNKAPLEHDDSDVQEEATENKELAEKEKENKDLKRQLKALQKQTAQLREKRENPAGDNSGEKSKRNRKRRNDNESDSKSSSAQSTPREQEDHHERKDERRRNDRKHDDRESARDNRDGRNYRDNGERRYNNNNYRSGGRGRGQAFGRGRGRGGYRNNYDNYNNRTYNNRNYNDEYRRDRRDERGRDDERPRRERTPEAKPRAAPTVPQQSIHYAAQPVYAAPYPTMMPQYVPMAPPPPPPAPPAPPRMNAHCTTSTRVGTADASTSAE